MIDKQRVIDVAIAELGYLEKASNKQLDDKTANAGSNNYTKYFRDLDALGFYNGRKNGFAWCDGFVDWCHLEAYGYEAMCKMTFQKPGAGNCGAGCKYSRRYYEQNGHLFWTPEIGDQIFFWQENRDSDPTAVCHTGLVVGVDANYVYTIEGNTSDGTAIVPNGGAVCRKKYALGNPRIAGYGRPDWSVIETPDKPVSAGDDACVLIIEGSRDELIKIMVEHGGTLAGIIKTEENNHV